MIYFYLYTMSNSPIFSNPELDAQLNEYWYDVRSKVAYSGLNKFFYFLTKEKNLKLKKDDVKNWLLAQKTYSLYYPVKKSLRETQ